MLAKTASDFIRLRVAPEKKKLWEQSARRDHRTLSNWIVHQLETAQLNDARPIKPTQVAPGKA